MEEFNPLKDIKAKLKKDVETYYEECERMNNRLDKSQNTSSTFLERIQNLKTMLFMKYFGASDDDVFTSKYFSEKEGGLRNLGS
jgi:hypothetical protein